MLLRALVKAMLPEAGPGAPAAGANVTLNCLLWPARMVNGNAGKPEIENVAPETFAAVMITSAPLAVSVPVCAELTMPSGTEPKLSVVGESPSPAPTPFSVIDDGVVVEALLVNDRLPNTLPVANGEKLKLKACVCPGASVTGKVIPLKPNPAPVSVLFVIVTLPPEAVSVPDCNGLVVPTVMFVNVKPADGEIESTGTVAKFTPDFVAFEIVTC
jgi:hypothetical protein